jgi:hypothetical protein
MGKRKEGEMRRALIGLAVTTFTVLALAGPTSAAPGQVIQFRSHGTSATADWTTTSATSSTNTVVGVTSKPSELLVDQTTVNLDATGNVTGSTDTMADVTSGFSFAIDKSKLTSASTSGSGLPAITCITDANGNQSCTHTTIDVAATWTSQGPITRVFDSQHSKQPGLSQIIHVNGTARAATVSAIVGGRALSPSDLQFAFLAYTLSVNITRCIGLGC